MASSRLIDLADEMGVTFRQADHWCRRGYIPGLAGQGTGLGPRTLTIEQVKMFKFMCRLVRAGLKPEIASQAASGMVKSHTGYADLPGGVRVLMEDHGE